MCVCGVCMCRRQALGERVANCIEHLRSLDSRTRRQTLDLEEKYREKEALMQVRAVKDAK